MRADAILDKQVEVLHWMQTTQAASFFTHYADSMANTYGDDTYHEMVYSAVSSTIGRGESYYLSGDVKDLLIAASKKLPDDAVLNDIELPSHFGFVQLERPYLVNDISGKTFEVWALGWARAQFPENARKVGVEWGVIFSAWTRPYVESGFRTPYDLFWIAPWHTEIRMNIETIMESYPGKTREQVEAGHSETLNLVKFFTAFFYFVKERVPAISSTRMPVSRSARRRAERVHIQIPSEVQVIELRRREATTHEATGESSIEWTHRWIVNGFFRRQWYPSTGTHRLKWIDEFVKGPEHLPLVVKDKLYKVDR